MLIQRKIAQIIFGANGGKPGEFNQFWPYEKDDQEPDKKVWGSADEAAQLRKDIEKAHGIKLS